MTERFVSSPGTISVANGASLVTGTGTLFGGADRAGAQVWVHPAASAPYRVGSVAEVDPRGVYDNLQLPLVSPWRGAAVVDQPYELVDSIALASGATVAAILARHVAHLEQNAGLVYDASDSLNYALIENNSLVVDAPTRTIYRWRNGVLDPVYNVGLAFTPRGAWAGGTTYAKNDLVETGGAAFVSNVDSNTGHTPDVTPSPASDSYWTLLPVATVTQVLAALGVHAITISEDDPSGGQDGDIWFKVTP